MQTEAAFEGLIEPVCHVCLATSYEAFWTFCVGHHCVAGEQEDVSVEQVKQISVVVFEPFPIR